MISVHRDSSLSPQDRTQNPLIRKETTMNNVERRLQPQVTNLSPPPLTLPRRSFLRRMGLGAVALAPGAALLSSASKTFGDEEESQTGIRAGDAALLRFAAAAEILEADFWIQYNELGGVQDSEVPRGSGNPGYTEALEIIEDEMRDYIHD